MLGVHGRDALERGAHVVARVAVPSQPDVRPSSNSSRADALDEPHQQVVAVAEVDVEGGPRERRARHHLVDREVAERALAQERLGRVEDLALGRFGAAPAPGLSRGGRAGRLAIVIDSASVTLYVRASDDATRAPEPQEDSP